MPELKLYQLFPPSVVLDIVPSPPARKPVFEVTNLIEYTSFPLGLGFCQNHPLCEMDILTRIKKSKRLILISYILI